MLTVNGVTKKYKKFLANDNLSFTIADGEIGILLGPNGAGKSTIIKSIAGLLRYEGDIEINGIDNHELEAKKMLGYIPEMPALYDTLTIDEHLEFVRRAYKVEDTGIKEKLLERFELTDKRKKMGKELSKGMQQKVSICCALIHDPKVVIFDEPMVGLDPHAIKELKALFQELKAEGKTVLISTHMIDTIEDYWDVAHIMMNGKIAATKHNRPGSADEKSLDELFFQITEGSAAASTAAKKSEEEEA
ncbi:MAG: ABC transporter ATP-binding protein [Saccharofermentans sp.]|nr:ABC transporter ATP-binding protein [Saccharofermentans sp.]